ncbi:EAL domain-containing protein [Shewanella avicenniae]|uniref:EAL domain-containing protein n=2 Tax=Shewanella avicenniae TaxID=2814294 RepID=A0ABX7QU01_9GAMM|nr:EAL domain-containing protein [Shewanella avicenniae]QSX34964.1 EAL domain-containing protein [Shewanella avicenniae]
MTNWLLSEKVGIQLLGIDYTKTKFMPIKILGLLLLVQLSFSLAAYSAQASDDTSPVANGNAVSTDVVQQDGELEFSPPVLLNVDSYGVSEGLSQSTVTAVAEDDDGYIWIGTLNGLNRFDGKEFKQFYANDGTGLGSSLISSVLYSNSIKALLVATPQGLFKYNKNTESFENYKIYEPINDISEYENKITITTPNAIIGLTQNTTKNQSTLNNLKKSIELNNNVYYLTFGGNLYKNEQLIKSNILQIENFNDESFIALTESKLLKISTTKIQDFSNDSYLSITIKNKICYAINTRGEIYSIGETGRIKIGKIDINNNKIFSITKTSKSLIFSTSNNGFIISRNTNNIISTIESTKSDNIWSVKKFKDKVLYADESDNLKLYSLDFRKSQKIQTEIIGTKAIEFNDFHFFVGNISGLYIINRSNGGKNKILSSGVNILTKSEDTNYLYIGTVDGLVIKYDLIKNKTIQTYDVDLGNPIFDIIESNEHLIAATQGGTFLIDEHEKYRISDKFSVSVAIDKSSNNIFIGTLSGIETYDLERRNLNDVYYSGNPIFSIMSIDNYVISTSVRSVIIYDKVKKKNYILSSKNGAQPEYNTQGIISDDRGNLIFAGTSGLNLLNLEKFIKNLEPSENIKTNLENLYLFNKQVAVGSEILSESINTEDELKLKYSDYPFSIYFSSPDSGYKNIKYRYKLDGFDSNWLVSTDAQLATYTNIAHGEYYFIVNAINPITSENSKEKRLKIIISPPWWLTTTAKICYSIMTFLILVFLIKAYLRRRSIQRQIAQSEERLKLSLWGSGDEMWDWDIETGKIYRSNIWGALEFPMDGQRSGKNGEESNIHPQDQQRVKDTLDRHFRGETEHFEATYRVRSKNDDWLWILDRAKIVERDDKDQPLRMTGTIKNINSFKTAEEQLRLFERAIENISEGVFILDTEFHFVEVNDAACIITKYSQEQMLGSPLHFSKYSADYNKQLMLVLKQQGRWSSDIEAIRGDGSEFLMELTVDAIYDEQGTLTHYVGVFSDISHRKKQEAELRRLTNNDLLTGLPNRSNLQVTLENLVKKDSHHTLMMMDLDNFKKINDSLGHQVGDELLKKVAIRLKTALPKSTNLYRLGGDEFAILIDNNPDIGSSAIIANDIIEAFRDPFALADEILVVGVSIGIVLYPEDEQNEQALLRKADIAMYHAKSAGGNRYQFYSESLNRNALRQLEVESLIREALRDDYFEVYFQPKISLATNKLAGMEALVRLNHPKHGLISPGEFIPLAEETGLIVEIGDVVLKKACFAAQDWRQQGIFNGRVAVNLSSRQFALPDLQARIEEILQLTKLPAANLELEITEGTVIKQPEKAIKVMHQLAKLGISLALDDFGTGYSSLSYLKRFPIHTLKIDKAFVDDIDKSDRDLKMVDSIITIAHNMGLSVVGEGVEQSAQLNILKALKCEEIQGFIYSKAISREEFTAYLERDMNSNNLENGTN